ncbi:hypothetical protein ACI8AX_16330, partial [Blastococcus sp. SYSU D00813]
AITAVGDTQRKADEAITAVGDTQRKADEAITAVGDTQRKADEAITAVGGTIERAQGAVGRAEGAVAQAEDVVSRVDPLLAGYEGPLRDLAPVVQRLAETMEPQEVEALVTMIDRLPTLLGHLDDDVLPVLKTLEGVGPDVHDLLDTMQDLRQVVKGFPGSRLFRRRGAEEIAEEEEEERTGS